LCFLPRIGSLNGSGLLLTVGSKASDAVDRSTGHGFLPKSSMSDYDQFITPNLNRVKHVEPSKIADGEEEQAVQKVLANNSSNPISLSAIGIGLVSLVTMLGLRLRRGLQPATIATPM